MATLTAPGLWLQRITTKPPPTTRPASPSTRWTAPWQLEEKQGGELVIA